MTTAILQDLPSATWALDSSHSSAGFALKYMVSTFRAGFERLAVELDTTGELPLLRGSVDPASITVKDAHFRAHLQAPDFFDSERHPAIRFVSTSWVLDGAELIVEGELTLKGETRPITARGELTPPTEDPFGGTRPGVTLEAMIDRTQFGLSWNKPLPKGGLALAAEVRLHVDLQLVLVR